MSKPPEHLFVFRCQKVHFEARVFAMMLKSMSIFAPVTFGKQSGCREEGGLRIIETCHPANLKLTEHEHEDPTIVAAISGGWDERIGRKSFSCRPGSFLVKRGGARHANSYGREPTRSLLIQLTVTYAAAWESSRKAFGAVASFESPKLTMRLVALLRSEHKHSRLELEEELSSVFSIILGERASGRRRTGSLVCLKRVRDELLDQPSESNDLKELARRCELTPSAFTHAFRSEFGCTPSSLIRHRRVETASFLLRTSNDSLSQIAANTGFADQAHLTREFRRLTGVTPGRFRQLIAR